MVFITAYGIALSEEGELWRPSISGSGVERKLSLGVSHRGCCTCRARWDKRSEVEHVLKAGKPHHVFGKEPLGKGIKRRQGSRGIALR